MKLMRWVAAIVVALTFSAASFGSAAVAQIGSDGSSWTVTVGGVEFEPGDVKALSSTCDDPLLRPQSVIYSTRINPTAGGDGLQAGTAKIRCGNKSWGLRHIDARHGTAPGSDRAWAKIVEKYPIGGTWEELMVFSFQAILDVPENVNYRESNDTWTYTAPVKISNKGEVVATYHPKISVASDSYNVITAYPQRYTSKPSSQ